MMNKLTFARDKVLVPCSVMLRQGHTKERVKRIDSLDRLLEKNLQRRQQILQFFSRGLLDPAVYEEENDALHKEEGALLEEKKTYTVDAEKKKRDNLADLMRYTAQEETLTDFDEELFAAFVDHIVIFSRTEVGFVMKCGPTFRERID